jgi:hypothetical protein
VNDNESTSEYRFMTRIFECLSNRLAVLALGGAVIAAGSALAFTEKEPAESKTPSASIPVDERPIAREFGGHSRFAPVVKKVACSAGRGEGLYNHQST